MDLRTDCLVAGRWVRAASGASDPVTDPATDQPIAEVPSLARAEVAAAVDAAWDAWPAWRSRTAADRAAIVARLGELLLREAEPLAALITREQGKPLAEAAGEVRYAASFLAAAAAEGPRVRGETVPAALTARRITVLRQPVGPCAIITPWNFPAAMITRKLGPALAAGCTAVIKPAPQTPLTAMAIAELAVEAGVPAGAINLVTGDAPMIGEVLTGDARMRKLSFTGSTAVGRLLMQQAAANLMRISLELGGHAPFIVFDDADLDAAVAGAVACKFRNAGQTCICANRFLVHESVHEAFVARLAEAMDGLRVGRGTEPGVSVGPLIDDAAVAKVRGHVADAVTQGATLVRGGEPVRFEGLADRFIAPTLLTGLTPAMRMHAEETFGPVAAVRSFATEAEAIAMANDTPYGLAAYFYTRDASRLVRVAESLEAGIVGANDATPSAAEAPFGGMKHSGLGREGGHQVMDEYTEVKYVSQILTDATT